MSHPCEKAIVGSMLGSAVGDALGLPMEGLSRRRQLKMFPDLEAYHFLGRRGMISDDTEHVCMTARALIESGGAEAVFAKRLAWKFRAWLITMPPGIGWATLRAIVKLWVGLSGEKSGVFSAGNGPAMRSALLGVCFGDDTERLRSLVKISTRLTHTDPKAEGGALAVALAAYAASRGEDQPASYLKQAEHILRDSSELLSLLEKARASVAAGDSTPEFAGLLGLEKGVTGYMYHTLPVAFHAWFRYPRNFLPALQEAIRCGGDSDTTASIIGGIIGAGVGKDGIPPRLLDNLWSWPLSISRIETWGKALHAMLSRGEGGQELRFPFGGLFLRNLFFLPAVLTYGFRRLLPPY